MKSRVLSTQIKHEQIYFDFVSIHLFTKYLLKLISSEYAKQVGQASCSQGIYIFWEVRVGSFRMMRNVRKGKQVSLRAESKETMSSLQHGGSFSPGAGLPTMGQSTTSGRFGCIVWRGAATASSGWRSGCCSPSCNAQGGPPQRSVQTQMLAVLKLRNPALTLEL